MGTRGGLAMRLGSMWPLLGEAFGLKSTENSVFSRLYQIGVFLVKFRKNNIEIGIQMGFYALDNIYLGGLRLNGQSPISRSAKHGDPRKQKKIQLKSHYIRPLSSLRVL